MYPEGGSVRCGVDQVAPCLGCPEYAGYFPSFPDRVLNPCRYLNPYGLYQSRNRSRPIGIVQEGPGLIPPSFRLLDADAQLWMLAGLLDPLVDGLRMD